MEVSGVLSSCDTLLTKSVFWRAKVICRLRSFKINQLPTAMGTNIIAIIKPRVSRMVFAIRPSFDGSVS